MGRTHEFAPSESGPRLREVLGIGASRNVHSWRISYSRLGLLFLLLRQRHPTERDGGADDLGALYDGIWTVEGQPLGSIDHSRRSYMSGTVLTVTLPLLRFKDRMLVTPNSIK